MHLCLDENMATNKKLNELSKQKLTMLSFPFVFHTTLSGAKEENICHCQHTFKHLNT